jgi:hypothetical protein
MSFFPPTSHFRFSSPAPACHKMLSRRRQPRSRCPARISSGTGWKRNSQNLIGREMTAPSTLFRPFSRLVKITILGRGFEVPENNSILRCLQYLAPEKLSYGRFCWNEDCQYCRIRFDGGEGTANRTALACKRMVEEGMQLTDLTTEIRYCLRDLNLTDGGE